MVDKLIGIFVWCAIFLALFMVIALAAKAGHLDPIPEEFDKGDYPDAVMIHTDVVSVHKVCADGIKRLGGEVITGGTYLACTFTDDTDACVLVLPSPSQVVANEYVQIRRHEMAHCWGWSH